MTTPAALVASIRQRLRNLAAGEDFNALLTRYALERLLYRLSVSPHRDAFVLKGAMLFAAWTGQSHRATRDLDLLGSGDADLDRLADIFREICRVPVEDDALTFGPDVVATRIREDRQHEGVRLRIEARLGNIRLSLQIDVGFGDAITPGPIELAYPTLLDQPAPLLRSYPRETVVAEKLEILVSLGIATSRMKDFYDLYCLANDFEFEGATLCAAVVATFAQRRTPIPSTPPIALTPDFADDPAKRTQWSAFLRRSRLEAATPDLLKVIEHLGVFLLPALDAARLDAPFVHRWSAGGPWI